ncbi:MAG: helix-turn-helix transcriptional regulator [Bacteroidota bacterium]
MINHLKVLRAKHNYTQSELASAIGVSRQTINAIEKGKFSPSLETAFRLAKVFSCSIEEIFEWSE